MITQNEFKTGKQVIYSDFNDKSFCTIELVRIIKRRAPHFWFDAVIVDNSKMDNDNTRKFHAVGSIHNFSNSFIYKDLEDLSESYKKTQERFINKMFKI